MAPHHSHVLLQMTMSACRHESVSLPDKPQIKVEIEFCYHAKSNCFFRIKAELPVLNIYSESWIYVVNFTLIIDFGHLKDTLHKVKVQCLQKGTHCTVSTSYCLSCQQLVRACSVTNFHEI